MRSSPGAHSAHVHPLAPVGWFAVSIVVTVASVAASTVTWLQSGQSWAAGVVFLVVGSTGALAASRRGRDAVTAFAGGMLVTVVSLYAALLVMAQVYAVVMD